MLNSNGNTGSPCNSCYETLIQRPASGLYIFIYIYIYIYTSKNYTDKFCSARRTGKQSYAQFLDKLSDLYGYYLESREITTFEQLTDDVIMQRLRASLPPDTRYFASARCAKSSWDLAKHAHLHLLCTTEARQGYDDTKQGGKPTRLGTITPGHNNGAEIHLPEKRNRSRRRGMGRLMHAQCILCRPVQTQTAEQIQTVRSMVRKKKT